MQLELISEEPKENISVKNIPSFKEVINGSINRCVAWYLINSYLYYICDLSVITDTEYDKLCKRLYDEFDSITHPHKFLVDKDALNCGTAFHLTEDKYPQMVKNSSKMFYNQYISKKRR